MTFKILKNDINNYKYNVFIETNDNNFCIVNIIKVNFQYIFKHKSDFFIIY